MKDNHEQAKPKNYVHLDNIHTTNIYKERKYEYKNKLKDYSFNPYCFYPITDKPQNLHPKFPNRNIIDERNRQQPNYQVNLDPLDIAFTKNKIHNIFKQHQQTPKEKYKRPQTANQEIGWYTRPLLDNRKWNRPVTATPITKYVSDYDRLKHINPFKLPVSKFSMK